jgi:hypothetical protein
MDKSVQEQNKNQDLRSRVNDATTKLAVVATPLIMATGAHAAEGDIDVGTLAVGGLAVAAAAVFAIKAGPALLMWGYSAILGFLKKN